MLQKYGMIRANCLGEVVMYQMGLSV